MWHRWRKPQWWMHGKTYSTSSRITQLHSYQWNCSLVIHLVKSLATNLLIITFTHLLILLQTSVTSSQHNVKRKKCRPLKTMGNQAQNEHKHSLTFHVRHYVVTAMKPVHRLQICPILHKVTLLNHYTPLRTLRSANQYRLQHPRVSTEFAKRSFGYLAPKIWNNIPLDIRLCSTLPTFKRHLKTYLFK